MITITLNLYLMGKILLGLVLVAYFVGVPVMLWRHIGKFAWNYFDPDTQQHILITYYRTDWEYARTFYLPWIPLTYLVLKLMRLMRAYPCTLPKHDLWGYREVWHNDYYEKGRMHDHS